MSAKIQTEWNSFARTNASDRWRKQSALMGTPLTELVVRETRIEPDMRVLDVASGTGEPAISLAAKLNGSGEVTATDISPGPLKIAERRAQQRRLANIRFQVADVHSLPFDNHYFDRVTSRLGLMFFADLRRALSEICRVLKPGGTFTAVAWGSIRQPYFEVTVGTVLKHYPELRMPESGLSMFKFAPAGTLSRALKEVGFSEANDEACEVEWNWAGTPEDLWDYFQAVTVPFAPLLKSVPEAKKQDLTNHVVSAMRPYSRDGAVHFKGEFILCRATR